MTPPNQPYLTDAEKHILDTLADAWTAFIKLRIQHPSSQHDFCQAIHVAQNIILARPTLRQLNNSTPDEQ